MDISKIYALNHEALSIRTDDRKSKMQQLGNDEIERDVKLREKAKELESLFVTQLLKVMEGTVPGQGITGGGNSLASMMFSNVIADNIASQGGLGISDLLYNSLREKGIEPGEMPEQDMFMENLNLLYGTVIGEEK